MQLEHKKKSPAPFIMCRPALCTQGGSTISFNTDQFNCHKVQVRRLTCSRPIDTTVLVEAQTAWGIRYHGVLQQVLQFAQSAVLVTGVLSLDGFLELPQIWLTVPGVTHKLVKGIDMKTLQRWQQNMPKKIPLRGFSGILNHFFFYLCLVSSHLEVCRVVFEMLLHTRTQLVHPLPLSLQGCAVCLMTCRRTQETKCL